MLDVHPSNAELNDFLVGKLSDREYAAVEDHLSTCEECVARAAGSRSNDTLVELLAAAATRLSAQWSSAATVAPQDTHSVPGTCAGSDLSSTDAAAAPPGLADHPRYKLLRRLGEGGMGSVWLAEHLVLGRVVAIKVIRPEFLSKPGAAERFRREARAVARLSHPNIVAAFDAEEASGTHFLVMEHVEGENLGDVFRRAALPLAEACRAVRDAARGLAHAHSRGLAHRDIKPHNLIRSGDGVTKILDFGLATAEAGSFEGLTGENIVLGTPDYIAPEQAQDPRAADARSDVYSLGCTLFALLSGQVPYAGGTVLAKLDAHRHNATPELPGAPREVVSLVRKMMAKRPEDRPSATDVDEALTLIGSHLILESPVAQTQSQRRRPLRWGVVVGVLIAMGGIVAGAVVSIIQREKQEQLKANQRAADPDQIRRFVGHTGAVRAVAYSPDGKYVLSGSGWPWTDGTARLWEAATGREVWESKVTGGWVNSVAFCPNDRILIGGNIVRLLDLKTGHTVRNFAHPATVHSVAVSPNGRLALSGGDDHMVRVWDLESGRPRQVFGGHTGWVVSVAFSPDGQQAVSGGGDGKVRVWEVETGEEARVYTGTPGKIGHSITFTPNGKQVLFGDNDRVLLWDLEAGDVVRTFEPLPDADGYISLAISPDGKRLLGAGNDTILRLWDFESGKLLRSYSGHSDTIWGMAFSPDGNLGVSGSGGWAVAGRPQAGNDYSLRLWRLPDLPTSDDSTARSGKLPESEP